MGNRNGNTCNPEIYRLNRTLLPILLIFLLLNDNVYKEHVIYAYIYTYRVFRPMAMGMSNDLNLFYENMINF